MKAILISTRPEWVIKIIIGIKKDEIRKGSSLYKAINKLIAEQGVAPMLLYCTKDRKKCLVRNNINKTYHLDTCYWDEFESNLNGKVVARFWCDKVEEHRPFFHWCIEKETCLTRDNVLDYLDSKDKSVGNPKRQGKVYAIHITKLEIFDKPKEISEFYLAFSYKGEKPFINAQTNSLVHRVEINGKIEYESVSHLTRAPQSWCYIEV